MLTLFVGYVLQTKFMMRKMHHGWTGGTSCPNIKITTLFTTAQSLLTVSQSCRILLI